jgi:UDP-2,3-diacylglucosamine pyrophosphatase LpxH
MDTSIAPQAGRRGRSWPRPRRSGPADTLRAAADRILAEPAAAEPDGKGGTVRVRAIFLSDLHLGTRGCQAEQVLSFLRRYEAELVYVVGDIVDGWQLKSDWYWPQAHNDVVQELLRKARGGTRMVYVPGNHDEFLRGFYGTHFGGIEVAESVIHCARSGRRYLVIHGDLFDLVITQARWLALLGGKAYDLAIALNTHFNAARRFFGMPYWSLSQWVKLKVKNAVNFISAFEETLAAEAARQGADGVICGHIHHAVIRDAGGSHYLNCGDWVESCTAIVEHPDGRFAIVRWAEELALAHATARGPAHEGELLSA